MPLCKEYACRYAGGCTYHGPQGQECHGLIERMIDEVLASYPQTLVYLSKSEWRDWEESK